MFQLLAYQWQEGRFYKLTSSRPLRQFYFYGWGNLNGLYVQPRCLKATVTHANIHNPHEKQIIADDEPVSVTLVFFRVASGWKAVEPYLWPFALEKKRREAKTKKPHFSPSPRQFVPKPVLSFGSLWNHLHFSALIKFIAFLNRPPVWPIDVFFSHSETWRSQLNQININESKNINVSFSL